MKENIVKRLGLCLFILIAVLCLTLTELSLYRSEQFSESTLLELRGRIVKISLPASSNHNKRSVRLRLNQKTIINIQLTLGCLPAGLSFDDVQLGSIMTVTGVYSGGKDARNPGGFSEKKWFRSEGINGKLTGVKVKDIKAAPRYYNLLNQITKFRLYTLKLLEENFNPKSFQNKFTAHDEVQLSSQGVMQALLMGHTGNMTAYTRQILSEAGAYHLVCVSGMHLMFFLLPFQKLFSWTSVGFDKKRKVLTTVAFFPALLSGFGYGISRATLIFLLQSLDSNFNRRSDKVNSLALAGSSLLLLQPFAIRQNGFWMSFIAAGSLSVFSIDTKDIRSNLLNGLFRSLGVFFILLPFSAKRLQGVNLLAPFANMILIPMATYLTFVGFSVIFLSLLFPFASREIQYLASLLTDKVLEFWLKLVSSLANYRNTFICYPQLITVGILMLGILVFYLIFRLLSFKNLYSALLALLLIFPFHFLQELASEEKMEIIFLDVGQGDSTLLLLPNGRTLLVDGGSAGMGYQRLLPALRSQGRDHIDLALVTHGHADHVLGVIELMSLGRIDSLLLPRIEYNAENRGTLSTLNSKHNLFEQKEHDWMPLLLETAAEDELAVTYIMAGEEFTLSSAQFRFIAPSAEDLLRSDDANDTSLVFYLDYHQHTFLFTADMTKETEERLVRSTALRQADYLHVAHHGSGQTSGIKFLEQIQAHWAIVSVGENNIYGHPHPDTIDRLDEQNIITVRLDEHSAFFLQLSEADSRIIVW